MRATDFEFRHRFWFIAACFAAGFSCYFIDHRSASRALMDLLGLPGATGWRAVGALATILVVGAASLRTWASAYLRSEVVMDRAVRTEALVADGPYRHVRNPLYLAVLLLGAAMGLFASRAGLPLLLGGLALFLLRLIGREESELLAAHGSGYQAFCARVPRLLPALRPRLPPAGTPPRWGPALASEAWMWGFAVATAAFAATLDLRVLWTLTGVSLALYLLVRWRHWSRQGR